MRFVKADWNAPSNVRALMTTREGGISTGAYSGMNLGAHVGDNPEFVKRNRQSLIEKLQLPTEPLWLNQQHTVNVIDQSSNTNDAADGIYTDQSGVVCAIMTADCLPLFICNKSGTEIALLHAGWRGLADGIIEQALKRFTCPMNQLLAWAGVAISQKHFEIGEECKKQIGGSENFYRASDKVGHYYADLYGLVGECLAEFEIEYSHAEYCSYEHQELFFSYRRDGTTGRMASLLWIE